MKSKRLVLYTAFHKPYTSPNVDWVIPIHAGKSISNTELAILGDNTGDNISDLNPIFCELTVAYWVWKNVDRTQFEYWGLMHYRRYLVPSSIWDRLGKRKLHHFSNNNKVMNSRINNNLQHQFLTELNKYDAIISHPSRLHKKNEKFISIEQHYKQHHIVEHWDLMVKVLIEKYPNYKNSIIFFQQNHLFNYNMMIASWAIWDSYLTWLFDILFEVYNQMIIPDDIYQRRSLGFLSERMLNLYIYHNNLTTKEYLTANFG